MRDHVRKHLGAKHTSGLSIREDKVDFLRERVVVQALGIFDKPSIEGICSLAKFGEGGEISLAVDWYHCGGLCLGPGQGNRDAHENGKDFCRGAERYRQRSLR